MIVSIAGLLQRVSGVDAAIIELDPLPDPVRPAAEDDDLLRGRVGWLSSSGSPKLGAS